jgi:hypothetical protein
MTKFPAPGSQQASDFQGLEKWNEKKEQVNIMKKSNIALALALSSATSFAANPSSQMLAST